MKKSILTLCMVTMCSISGIVNAMEIHAENPIVEVNTIDKKWDKLLDSYESYVNQYIKLLEKVAKGDMDAMLEYPTYLQKAQDLSKQLEKAKGDISPEQLKRYNKINLKMLKAAEKMQ